MSTSLFVQYLNPWKAKRQKAQQRVDELRRRDGDNCRRCRRPIRFDLTRGHDRGPKLEQIRPLVDGETDTLENLCLCHGRCVSQEADSTIEVKQRIRVKNEVELFARSRAAGKAA
ncbi:HNH endonuclease [Sphingomonas hankyongi]|uniref:HNH endonuclease n=1 Tax=Sphingomonas hankyongi TaxID=2908209 RepID=A0ABT0RZM4_9SPHN|nr:hypothetical protein [Sphingomonas hankyongi]MCL6729063.1 hypothetical protein [Sphingomonas hankyongi]